MVLVPWTLIPMYQNRLLRPADLSSMLKVRNTTLEYLWLVFNVVVVWLHVPVCAAV
jgi:hypothetical protein